MPKEMRGISRFCGLVFFLIFFLVEECFADRIVLENGDTLTGKVETILEGKLTLKTDYAGPIQIPVGKIKDMITEDPVEVYLTTGEILKGRIKGIQDGQIVLERVEETTPTTTDWTKVAKVNPPPVKWTGNVAAGGNLQRGNTDRTTGFISADLGRRTEKDRIKFRYLFNYAEDEDEVTARNHYGEGKYDYFFTKKVFGYMALELYNDKFSDTKLRTFVGPGIGYQVWEDPVKSLSVEAGLSYFNLDRYDGTDEDGLTARFASDFRYNIFKWLIFTDRFQFYPTIGEGGEYFFRNEAGLNMPFSPRWSLKLANIIDYNSDPSQGDKRTDVQWLLGLQLSF
jgi:putative salt-induced outer membrane protein YdiY